MITSRALSTLTHRAARLGFVVALLGPLACAGTKPASGSSAPPTSAAVIQRNELLAREFTNLFDAIQALRGNWLRDRGSDSFSKPTAIQVYLDNQRMGGLEQLRTISPRTVAQVRRYDGIEATSRWGMDHGAGVIAITTAR
ncbi:MAG: hypothetical protein H7066_13850 [Cytophagaceae bacterium]|nr:hypothetical protein [Gemmatimonadaceae bacterium]